MVIPVSPRLREMVEGPEYEAAVEKELEKLSYRLRLSGEGAGPERQDSR